MLISLPSVGVHYTGFSLVRKAMNTEERDLLAPIPALGGLGLGEALLAPTRIYVKPVLQLMAQVEVKGISHITGGGFYENIPRSLPEGMGAFIERKALVTPPLFDLIAREGGIPMEEMYNTFNMGVGMSIAVAAEDADRAISLLQQAGEKAYIMGEVRPSDTALTLC